MFSKYAVKKSIPPGSSDPRLDVVVGVILHVDAGNASSLYGLFQNDGGIESHGFIKKDGTYEQYRDYDYEADANYRANSWVVKGKRYGYISIETQGYGAGTWTAAQIATIKKVILEASAHYGFAIRECSDPFGGGIGYHTMWGAPSAWTPVSKTCPGPDRIKQFNKVLVPWFANPWDRMDPGSYFVGAQGAHVTWLGQRLIAHGYATAGYKPGPVFTSADLAQVRHAQTALKVPNTTGLPGKHLLTVLSAEPRPAAKPKPKPKQRPAVAAAINSLDAAASNLSTAQKNGAGAKVSAALAQVKNVLAGLRGK